jgi:biopolymer transport protein ExbD
MSLRRLAQRRGSGAEKPPSLNLVSLMDIFTILVFFLMVNANEIEILETSTAIKLPDSISEDSPENRVSIEVSHDELLVQGQAIASINDIMADDSPLIDALVSALDAAKNAPGAKFVEGEEGRVTIMGDEALPYELLKRVMLSCQTANFTRIALAVNQVREEGAA